MTQYCIGIFENAVREHSFRLGCKSDCHLILFPTKNSFLDNRKILRKKLVQEVEKLGVLSPGQKKELLTPGTLTQKTPFAAFSLSHIAFAGGFIITPDLSTGVGFDLEQPERAKEKTVLRISNKEELSASPSPYALWSAKESAYKSVSLVLSGASVRKILVFDWKLNRLSGCDDSSKSGRSLRSEVYDYRFSVKQVKGKGFVCVFEELVIACAFADSARCDSRCCRKTGCTMPKTLD